jgi:hypothetical protein
VILADSDIAAGMPRRPALTREDVASRHRLTPEKLDAKAAAGRVTAVARRSACFLVSHCSFPYS